MFDNVTLCFHKGENSGFKRLLSNIIKMWTKGEYSHVELYFPSKDMCFSASGYENKVRWKKINFSHINRWDFCSIYCNLNIEEMLKRCDKIDGAKYDHLGAFFSTRFKFNNNKRWYCSEACAYVLGWKPYQLNPQQLYIRYLEKKCRVKGEI